MVGGFFMPIFHTTNIQTELTNSKPKNKSIFFFKFIWISMVCIV